MDKVTEVKRNYREQMWGERIRQCQGSTMTVREWCTENNVNEKSYYYWLRKVRGKLCEKMPGQSIVAVYAASSAAGGMELICGDISIRFGADTPAEKIAAVIRALRQC